MKLRITGRLFLVILATNIAIAVAVGVAEQVSFDRGFREYMREREGERLAVLADVLASHWRAHGSFEALRGNEAQWQREARLAGLPGPWREGRGGPPPPFPGERAGSGAAASPDGAFAKGPPPRGAAFDAGAPPSREPGAGTPPSRNEAPAEGRRPPGPPGPFPAVLDAQRQPLVGTLRDGGAGAVVRPVVVDGATVGFVAGVPMREPFSGAEQRLAEQQATASYVIAVLAVLLAALVAFFVARGFIAPLRRLAAATHRLAEGDYATRVTSARSDEIGQLSADFDRLAHTLEANESMRRHFMADISHELRTPLAILRGELEALEDGIRTLTPERLRSLQAEVAMLGKLVEDLYELSLADVGALALHPEHLDLREPVATAVRAFDERFAARDIRVEQLPSARPVPVHADAGRLLQVLNNLLENCARYTDAGGVVRVRVGVDGGDAVVDIEDSAPGVPPDALPRLFDRLYRVDASRNRRSGGAGLGLALARAVIEGHAGTIVARPSPLGGLWIRVTLPVDA